MRHNWENLKLDAEAEGPFSSIAEMAATLGLPYGTVYDALNRGDLPTEQIVQAGSQPADTGRGVQFRESGNQATLKFRNAEPMSAEEVMDLAGLDKKEWKVADVRINMWQVGRKHTVKDLFVNQGTMDGRIQDTGEIKKEYLYQIEVKLQRRRPIAVKPVIRPLELTFTAPKRTPSAAEAEHLSTILFVTDPHFGYRRLAGALSPIHHRKFLSGVIAVAQEVKPGIVVWGGDTLDMAEFSTFTTEPELLFSLQLAGIEAAWVLAQTRATCLRQVVLEGNHDERLNRSLIKNMQSAYQIRPVDELQGPPMMSVPRFLGLDSLDTEWVGGYPNSHVRIGTVKFMHGNTVRTGSAKTVSAIAGDSVCSKIFGHIHRYELAQKYIGDFDNEIFVGTPGCACRRDSTPGANEDTNWQLGAFIITLFPDGEVANVERIRGDQYGEVIFRGRHINAADYYHDFIKEIPEEYRRQYNG